MKTIVKIFLGLFFLTVVAFGQKTTLKICIADKVTKEPILNKPITVVINDTLTKTLTADEYGYLAPIWVEGNKCKVQVSADNYKTETLKKVGIDCGRGRILLVYLKPIKP